MRKRVIGVVAVVLAGLGAGGYAIWHVLNEPVSLDAPAPVVQAEVYDSAEVIPPSIVDAPIEFDLGPAIAALETAVPRTFGDIEKRTPIPTNSRMSVAFGATRAPFSVKVDGLKISITSVVEYEGRGWFRPPIGPTISAACGTGGVPRPRLRVTIQSDAALTPDWQLRTRSRISRLEPFSDTDRDHCRVTVFRVDVTSRVVDATRPLLEKQLATLDGNLSRLDTRSSFEGWWRKLQLPIRLTDSIYLTINPRSAQLGPVTSDDGVLVANVRLAVQPEIVSGARPNDFALIRPIPPLGRDADVGRGLRVSLDGSITYPVATSLLRKALNGRRVHQSGRTVRIVDVGLSGIGGGRVALGVRLAGAVVGRVFFTGTPRIDTLTRQIVVDDLDYDVGTSNLLVQSLKFMRGDELRDLLRARARLPDEDAVEQLRVLAEKGMNRELADGVDLSAKISRARGLKVYATTSAVRVRAVASGEATLKISRRIVLPRKVAPQRAAGADPFKLPAAHPSDTSSTR